MLTALQEPLAKATHKPFMVWELRERRHMSFGLEVSASTADAQGEREVNVIGLQNPSQAWVCSYCTFSLLYYDNESLSGVRKSRDMYKSELEYE